MYLTRGGYVTLGTGSLRLAGDGGDYWASSASQSSLYAFNLYFNSPNVFPSTNADSWNGFTVRKAVPPIIAIGWRNTIIIRSKTTR